MGHAGPFLFVAFWLLPDQSDLAPGEGQRRRVLQTDAALHLLSLNVARDVSFHGVSSHVERHRGGERISVQARGNEIRVAHL